MSKAIPVIIFYIFIVLIVLVLLIGIYFYNWNDLFYKWFNLNSNNNYVKYFPPMKAVPQIMDSTNDLSIKNNLNEKIINTKKFVKLNKTVKDITSDKIEEKIYGKGSNIGEQNFHSLGEYVSEEEQKYRESLVKNLKIKTVIINSLTKGNGVSQEYYKVVYQSKMIPAKILEQIVESKEFRNLIPEKYLTKEIEVYGLKKDEYISFKNTDIAKLLKEWCLGRLTPVQKAWSVKAVK